MHLRIPRILWVDEGEITGNYMAIRLLKLGVNPGHEFLKLVETKESPPYATLIRDKNNYLTVPDGPSNQADS